MISDSTAPAPPARTCISPQSSDVCVGASDAHITTPSRGSRTRTAPQPPSIHHALYQHENFPDPSQAIRAAVRRPLWSRSPGLHHFLGRATILLSHRADRVALHSATINLTAFLHGARNLDFARWHGNRVLYRCDEAMPGVTTSGHPFVKLLAQPLKILRLSSPPRIPAICSDEHSTCRASGRGRQIESGHLDADGKSGQQLFYRERQFRCLVGWLEMIAAVSIHDSLAFTDRTDR